MCSSATGTFSFDHVRVGAFTLTATLPNGDSGTATGTVGASANPVTTNVTLKGLGQVMARVVGADGVGVANALVMKGEGSRELNFRKEPMRPDAPPAPAPAAEARHA